MVREPLRDFGGPTMRPPPKRWGQHCASRPHSASLARPCRHLPCCRARSDPKSSSLEVDVVPLQTEHLALTQADAQRHGPSHGVSPARRGGHDRSGLADAQRFDLALLRPLRPGCRYRIPIDFAPPDRLAEAGPQGPMHALHRNRADPPVDQPDVDGLDVLGGQVVQPHPADRLQVLDMSAVRPRRGRFAAPLDDLDPGLGPLPHRRRPRARSDRRPIGGPA